VDSNASAVITAFCVVVAGCAVPRTPASLPPGTEAYVAVLSGEMPGAISQVARHSWIVANVPGDANLHRFEFGSSYDDPFRYFGEGDVAVHGIVHYDRAGIVSVVDCLRREEAAYGAAHPDYFPIPGPNSNTIVDWMLRHCDIHVELPATAIGRDYRGPVGASVTSRGTGVQLETWVFGVKLGLEEGVEAHLLDMALGVHFWPPGITVPVNPGRIGFDDSTHRQSAKRDHYVPKHPRDREYGLASLWMWSHYAHVVDPEDAGGLTDLGTVGVTARGGYGKSIGYGFGMDLEAGLGFSPGFAYAARLYPAGLVLMLGDNTFLGAFGGVGANGVGGHVPSRFELPTELRLEIDVAPLARVGARMSAAWYPGSDDRQGATLLTFADEVVLSTFLRIGRADPCDCQARIGRGYFFALERGNVMRSAWVGASFGVEVDLGG
jgi:hypothetical protein